MELRRFQVEGHEALNRALLKEIAKRRASEPSLDNGHIRYGWQSRRDFFQRREPAHRQLAAIVERAFGTSIEEAIGKHQLGDLKIAANGWVNVNPSGGYNSPHHHGEALFSAVYYVAVGSEGANPVGGMIEFVAPHAVPRLPLNLAAPMLAERVRVKPEPGLLLLFPGTLVHWVHPNDGDGERVTIACNATLRPGRT